MRIKTQVVLDASGDADLAVAAGVPCEQSPHLQAMTTTFRVGGVDVARANKVSKDELTSLLAEAAASNEEELPNQRRQFLNYHSAGRDDCQYGACLQPGTDRPRTTDPG